MKTKFIVRAGVIIAVAVVAFFFVKARSDKKTVKAVETPSAGPTKEMVTLGLTSPSAIIKLPGDLMAWNETKVYAKVKSFVKTVLADRGTRVRRGQLIAELEAPELIAEVNRERSRVSENQTRFLASKASFQRLLKSSATIGAVSINELELSRAQMVADSASYKSSQAAYESVKELTQYLNVYAPYDGTIALRGISPGTLVGPEDITRDKPLFVLEDGRTLRLTVAVPEKYVDELIDGSVVKFEVDAIPHERFDATMKRKADKVEQDVRSMMVEFDVQNADGRLKPGMYADVSVAIRRGEATFNIPSSALLNSTRGVFIIASEGGKAHWIPVTTGNMTSDSVEIFGNLQAGMKIVKEATEETRDGEPL